jgi:hypothetical protein
VGEGLTLDAWGAHLHSRGHRVTEPTWPTVTGFTLWPDPDTLITVAVEPDAALYPRYRQRFFLCDPDPEQVFRVAGCPGAHRGRWLELVGRQPAGYWQDFMAGPGSWLLSRLARFREVVAWSEKGLPWEGLDCTTHRGWEVDIPEEAAPLFAATAGPESARPRLLAVADRRFPDAVAACLLFASVALRDCYLADADAAEVYLAHHHDKVEVFLPDAGARGQLLRDLQGAGGLFTDVSGFASTMDDEVEGVEDDGDAP